MTKEEFVDKWLSYYTAWTPESLVEFKREAKPCHCGEAGCEGWRMGWSENDPNDDLAEGGATARTEVTR